MCFYILINKQWVYQLKQKKRKYSDLLNIVKLFIDGLRHEFFVLYQTFLSLILWGMLQDIGWYFTLVVWLGGKLRNVASTSLVVKAESTFLFNILWRNHTWWFSFDLVDDRTVVGGAVVQRLATGDEVRAIGQKEILCGGPGWVGRVSRSVLARMYHDNGLLYNVLTQLVIGWAVP